MPEVLASGKVVYRKVCTEGSQTAKVGTDEQKLNMRLDKLDKQTHHCNVPIPRNRENIYQVDSAGIDGKKELLPGEVFATTS